MPDVIYTLESTTGAVWGHWVLSSGTATTTTVGDVWATHNGTVNATNVVWGTWTSGNASVITYPTNVVWQVWNTAGSATGNANVALRRHAPETAEQRTEHERREQEQRERWARESAEREAKLKEATDRAERLLTELLDTVQREEYQRSRAFHLVTSSGRRYRVRYGMHGNVDEVGEDGKDVARFCIHPQIGVPTPDNMAAQKLMLETNEEEFRKTANITRLRVDPREARRA